MPPDDHFRHLNADGRWPGFQWDGLERRSDGALQLFTLPRMGPEAASAAASPADAPAGIAVDRDGTIFWTDPGHDRVLAREGCFATDGPVPCIGGRGTEPARLNRPRGLVVLPHRRALLVVDAGNHRVQLFDLASFAVLDVWGSPAGVGPSAEVGRFDTPWTAAGDAAGSVYVVDRGNRRIQKFDRAGRVAPAFWETMQVAGLVTEPVDVAVHSGAHATRVYVLDAAARTVRVFDDQGHPLCDRLGAPLAIGGAQLRAPVGLAAGAEMLYVGDADPGRVRVFALTRDGVFAGDAVGYEG
ncbi:MAG TPA: NHL repeat-containing protein, partial [Candidatus Binatia bacterium]|nr:NHL repeat-containing protein [Candidatus Binatia bacterium]